MKRIAARAILVLAMVFSLVSGCQCVGHDPDKLGYDRVLILYSAGCNTLRNYLYQDIQDLKSGYLPSKKDNNAFLVVSHLSARLGDYSTRTYPQLIRVYRDKKMGVVFDTLKTYSNGNILVRSGDMKEVLSDIKQQFKADHYGMVYSSHGTGWLPIGYYNNADYYERGYSGTRKSAPKYTLPSGAVPYFEPKDVPGAPAVKSIGACNQNENGQTVTYEMNITDFAASIPMHLDYLLFDACLAGGIETAYELKDKCDVIGFSPAEILADGFEYKKLVSHLLEGNTANPQAVVEDYFRNYASKSDPTDRAATISLIDCSKLDELTSLCKTLFEKYRDAIAALNPNNVQRYYRNDNHWFYDLEDILVKAGINASERSSLTAALKRCTLYKDATEEFLYYHGGFKIKTFSGFSMYLPCNGSPLLDGFYEGLSWNKATLLVD